LSNHPAFASARPFAFAAADAVWSTLLQLYRTETKSPSSGVVTELDGGAGRSAKSGAAAPCRFASTKGRRGPPDVTIEIDLCRQQLPEAVRVPMAVPEMPASAEMTCPPKWR